MLLCVLTAGCSGAQQPGGYTLHSVVTPCPAPPPLMLDQLDAEKPLNHPDNLAKLMLNIDLLAEQLEELCAVVNCYETQAELGKELGE